MAIKVSQKPGEKNSTILYFHASLKSGEKRVRITNLDESQSIEPITLEMEDLPKFPKVVPNMKIDHCNVIFNLEENEVLAINPWRGVFEAVGIDIGPRLEDGGEPVASVKEKIGQDKKPYFEKKFYFEYRILDKRESGGFFFGTTPRQYLQDKFFERADGMTDISGTSKSMWTNRLRDAVLEQHLGDEDIPWREDGNVLPSLLERMQDIPQDDRMVRLTFKDGWIDSVLSLTSDNPFGENPFGDDDVDELLDGKSSVETVKIAPKAAQKSKTVKKAPAKVAEADDDL